MKINKKLIVPFLSTVVGLSIAGGLGGAFAWYQFNSQVRTGLIGSSVAETGLLQIGYKEGETFHWGSERNMPNAKLIPVTFGALVDGALPRSYAYGYPEAGQQINADYSKGWTQIVNGKGFVQYDIYLRALKSDPNASGDPTSNIPAGYKLVEQDVYLTDIVLEDAANTNNKTVADALRVHYQVDGGKKGLISNTAKTTNLYGKLDLDGDGAKDKYAVYEWHTKHGQEVVYGIDGQTQTTQGIGDVTVERATDGTLPKEESDAAKKICTTSTGVMTKITLTVWLEGWSLLQVDTATPTPNTSAVWNPKMNAGVDVHVGLTFDAGRNILEPEVPPQQNP